MTRIRIDPHLPVQDKLAIARQVFESHAESLIEQDRQQQLRDGWDPARVEDVRREQLERAAIKIAETLADMEAWLTEAPRLH